MSSSLVVRNNNTGLTFEIMEKIATVFAKSGRFPSDKNVYELLVKIQAGAEIGLQPFQSVSNIYFINGVRAFSYPLIGSKINESGRYKYRIIESTNKKCVLEFFEQIKEGEWESLGHSEYNEEDAKLANLLGKDNWKKYPVDMYFARALSRGARRFCPEVFGGSVYSKEEMEDTFNVKVENPSDDLGHLSFTEFVKLVKEDVDNSLTDEVITNILKDGQFSWKTSSKRAMFDYLVNTVAQRQDVSEADIVE